MPDVSEHLQMLSQCCLERVTAFWGPGLPATVPVPPLDRFARCSAAINNAFRISTYRSGHIDRRGNHYKTIMKCGKMHVWADLIEDDSTYAVAYTGSTEVLFLKTIGWTSCLQWRLDPHLAPA